jgi:hypothetical protein
VRRSDALAITCGRYNFSLCVCERECVRVYVKVCLRLSYIPCFLLSLSCHHEYVGTLCS